MYAYILLVPLQCSAYAFQSFIYLENILVQGVRSERARVQRDYVWIVELGLLGGNWISGRNSKSCFPTPHPLSLPHKSAHECTTPPKAHTSP